jgi:hypothetical protein
LLVLLAAVLCVSRAILHAAPITLRFEATVGPPRQGFDGFLPPGWNISLQEGDTISGTFTFEPFDAAPNTSKTMLVQPFDFSFHIRDRTLTTSQYGIAVFNNSMSDEVPEPRDRISLGCSAGVNTPSCIPAIVAAPEPLDWTFLLNLEGDSSVLDGADIPADALVWQQLIFSDSMGLTFIDNSAHRSYGFTATPTIFEAIPEPGNFLSLLFGTALMVPTRFCAVKLRPLICIRK